MDVALLLNINTGLLEEFPQRANEIVDAKVNEKLQQQQRRLKEIGNSLGKENEPKVNSRMDDEVIRKVRQAFKTGDKQTLDVFETRRLAYNIFQLISEKNLFVFAVDCIGSNWRNFFINGVTYSLCHSWNEYEPSQRELLYNLLKTNLATYEGDIKKYNILKNNINLLSQTGPKQLAAKLIQNRLKIEEAPTLLGNKNEAIYQSYYSDVVIEYVKGKHIENIVEIEQILYIHKKDRTRKLVYAQLVENAEKSGDVIYQQKVSESINRHLGEIGTNSTWAPFIGATAADEERLEHAKNLTRLWFIRKAIEVFFERCIQDPQRKRFWLSYIKHISDFRIAGSSSVRYKLTGDSRLSLSAIKNYFIESSSQYSETAALILKIKDRVFVEFSDVGALYCYKTNHPKAVYIEKVRLHIDKVEDLKEPKINALIYESYDLKSYSDEGKVMHSGRWEERMRGWLKTKLGISAYNISI